MALISRDTHFTRNFDAALFGNILGVDRTDLIVLGVASVAVALLVFFQYKPLLFTTFDPEVAPAYGIGRWRTDAVLSLALATAIIVTMNILGVTLIAAAIVIPATVARLVTVSFARMLVIGTLVGALTGAVGMYVSYFWDIASGATIVLTAAALFVVVLLAGHGRALGRRRAHAGRRRALVAGRPRTGPGLTVRRFGGLATRRPRRIDGAPGRGAGAFTIRTAAASPFRCAVLPAS